MILEIDYGNTRLKWRLLKARSLKPVKTGAAIDLQELSTSLKNIENAKIVYCRVCSVRRADDNAKLALLIKDLCGVAIEYAQSQQALVGVTNGYLDPSRLGVDRWLAIVAAYNRVQGACVVIDCGTAITVDYIRADGVHLGGCIVPGMGMMRAMLDSGTQLVKDTKGEAVDTSKMFGDTTHAAVTIGVRSMVSGFIKEQLQSAQSALGASFTVLCTGGDSRIVCAVAADARVEDDLVFVGLAIACPYSAKE
ncbi:type III pantothenate kinase [Denitrificimonas caeni]|uniref:type III pantothenate kinase n=1 Tax=Denitrificimonas caeni TaxID=521720 RepID=UPI00196609C8|nr:type III pantothenate kinase [Denitrificimonas caeni]